MVTHRSTVHPLRSLSMAEQTGRPVLSWLWPYVLDGYEYSLVECGIDGCAGVRPAPPTSASRRISSCPGTPPHPRRGASRKRVHPIAKCDARRRNLQTRRDRVQPRGQAMDSHSSMASSPLLQHYSSSSPEGARRPAPHAALMCSAGGADPR